MSQKELTRLEVIKKVVEKALTQLEASLLLGITDRQIRRLQTRYLQFGAQGLISQKRGQPSKRKIAKAEVDRIVEIIKDDYSDFGPTLAHEKLTTNHGVTVSVESVRKIMDTHDIRRSKSRKKKAAHQSRPRRSSFGELIQIDGSPHDWFEGRAEKCCLIVFIDDATSACVGMRFYPTETTKAYMEVARWHIKRYGLPISFYSDKHTIFKSPKDDGNDTQFGRAMKELGIQTICAETPQAKGRVERSNQTLQDRLVKEMRLRNINDIETANEFLEQEYIDMYNDQFAKPPKNTEVAHRENFFTDWELELILCEKHHRIVTKSLELSFDNKKIQLDKTKHRLKGQTITICESFQDGAITLLHDQELLTFRIMETRAKAVEVANDKTLNHHVDKAASASKKCRQKTKPKSNHPWRKEVCHQNTVDNKPSKQQVRDAVKEYDRLHATAS